MAIFVINWLCFRLLLLVLIIYKCQAQDIINICNKFNVNKSSQSTLFSIQPALKNITENQRVKIIIVNRTTSTYFKQVAIQVKSNITDESLAGEFTSQYGKTISCYQNYTIQDTFIQENVKKKYDKTEISWKPPSGFTGDVYFRAAFLMENSNNKWVFANSRNLRIYSNDSSAGPVVDERIARSNDDDNTAAERGYQQISSHHQLPYSYLYQGCYVKKGCFGFRDDCIRQRKCSLLVTHRVKDNSIAIQLMGQNAEYVTVAFSQDALMGNDVGVQCSMFNNTIIASLIWNDEGPPKTSYFVEKPEYIHDFQWSQYDGAFICAFSVSANIVINNMTFNLLNDSYHILVAGGNVGENGCATYHGIMKDVTSLPVLLSDVELIPASSTILPRLHAVFMIIAWLGLASTGIIFSRYMKDRMNWFPARFKKHILWLACHRTIMTMTVILSTIGIILMIIYLKGRWTSVPLSMNPHAVLGCLTLSFMYAQALIAVIRHRWKLYYITAISWFHFLLGHVTYILAIVTCVFGVRMGKVGLPASVNVFLSSFVVVHCITHLLLTVYKLLKGLSRDGCLKKLADLTTVSETSQRGDNFVNGDSDSSSEFPIHDARNYIPYEPNILEYKTNNMFQQIVICTYLIVLWLLTAVLITVVISPEKAY